MAKDEILVSRGQTIPDREIDEILVKDFISLGEGADYDAAVAQGVTNSQIKARAMSAHGIINVTPEFIVADEQKRKFVCRLYATAVTLKH